MSGKYSHSYLFVGPGRVGKTTMAEYISKLLLCEGNNMKPCGDCPSCKLMEVGNHPDFYKNDDQESISVDEVRGLIHFLELKPYQSKVKIALVSHAERMTDSAANSFLKTLEEPSENTLIFLTAENPNNLLPTIVSRAQSIRFGLSTNAELSKYLLSEYALDKGKIKKIVEYSDGRVGLAKELVDKENELEEVDDFIIDFMQTLDSKSIIKKIELADILSKDKGKNMARLDYLEIYLRQRLLASKNLELLKTVEILFKIAKSREYIGRNVNSRLVFESLLLGRI